MDWASIINQVSGLFVGGMIFAVCVGGFIFLQRHRYQKAVEGKIMGVFWGGARGLDFVLCRIEGNKIEPPESHSIQGSYLVKQDSMYPAAYPVGFPRFLQVPVWATSFIENQDEPILSRDPSVWLKNPERDKISARMRQTAMNESQMKIMAAMSAAVWKDISSMAQFIKNVPLMFKLIIGVIFILLIEGYLLYMVYAIILSRPY